MLPSEHRIIEEMKQQIRELAARVAMLESEVARLTQEPSGV